MTYSPEVTTILAMISERLSIDENFREADYGLKRVFLQIFAPTLFVIFDLTEDQQKEFAERYEATIIVPWCSEVY